MCGGGGVVEMDSVVALGWCRSVRVGGAYSGVCCGGDHAA